MIKPTLMIHRVSDDLFQYPLEKFLLTFDDGHDDHHTTFSKFSTLATQKIYFITCKWVGQSGFLTVDQIKYLDSFDDVTIGAHSFAHQRLAGLPFEKIIEIIDEDTAKTCEWFQKTLGFVPTTFAYPYNDCVHGIYTKILQKYGFTEFYGRERIDCAWLSTNPELVDSTNPELIVRLERL